MLGLRVSKGVAHVMIDAAVSQRPCITSNLAREITSALKAVEDQSDIACTVITGEGYSDGVDIQWLHEASIARDAESILAPLFALKSQLYSRQKPIFIAATNNCKGAAFELVLHADAVFAGPNASFSLPEVKLGIFPGLGGTSLLHNAIGKARANYVIIENKVIDSSEAYTLGIVSKVCPSNDRAKELCLRFGHDFAAKQFKSPCFLAEKEDEALQDTFVDALQSVRMYYCRIFTPTINICLIADCANILEEYTANSQARSAFDSKAAIACAC